MDAIWCDLGGVGADREGFGNLEGSGPPNVEFSADSTISGELGATLSNFGVTWGHFGYLMDCLGASLHDLWSKLGAL